MRYLDRIAIILLLIVLNEDALAAGRRASIVFRDSTKIIAEILAVNDSALTVTNMRADVRGPAQKAAHDTVQVRLAGVSRITLFGHSHAMEGAGIGAAIGGVVGAVIGADAARNATGDPVSVGFARGFGMWGGLLLGVIGGFFVGVVVGGSNVTDTYAFDLNRPGDVERLKELFGVPLPSESGSRN